MKLQVYVCHAYLTTADTVEVFFFVGMHLSLTNLNWRTEQLWQALQEDRPGINKQIYQQKLTVDNTSISVIVI